LRTSGIILPPARFGATAVVRESLVSPGASIDGTVLRSVISPGVVVEPGAEVRDSVIQHRCVIRSGAVVDRCIVDKEVSVGRNALPGERPRTPPDFEGPESGH